MKLSQCVAVVGLGMMAYGQLKYPTGPERDAFFDLPMLALIAVCGLEWVFKR